MKKLIFLIILLSIGLMGFSQDNFFGTYNQKLPTAEGGVYFDCQGGMYCAVRHVNNGGYAIKAAGYLVGTSSSTTPVLGNPLLQSQIHLSYPINYQSTANSGISNFYEGDYYTNRYYVITSMDDTIYGPVVQSLAPTCTSANPPTVLTCLGYPDITGSTATVCGQVLSDGDGALLDYGIVYSQTSPALANYASGDGTPYLGYNSIMTGLIPGMTYYYRAYGRNEHGYGYGTEYSFEAGSPYVAPTVSMDSVSNITTVGAVLYGQVISDGNATITVRGFVWNNTGSPTLTDNIIPISGTTGPMSYSFSGTCGTDYYVTTYATNSEGTTYGGDILFSPTSVNFESISFQYQLTTDTCGNYTITDEASAITFCSEIYSTACTSRTWYGYGARADNFSVGEQLYQYTNPCNPSTLTGWFVSYPGGYGTTTYVVYLSGGVIQSISQCYP